MDKKTIKAKVIGMWSKGRMIIIDERQPVNRHIYNDPGPL